MLWLHNKICFVRKTASSSSFSDAVSDIFSLLSFLLLYLLYFLYSKSWMFWKKEGICRILLKWFISLQAKSILTQSCTGNKKRYTGISFWPDFWCFPSFSASLELSLGHLLLWSLLFVSSFRVIKSVSWVSLVYFAASKMIRMKISMWRHDFRS